MNICAFVGLLIK